MGDAVAQMAYGAFSEWGVVPARHALPVPEPAPEVVALLTSGLTASIGMRLGSGFMFRPVPEVVALPPQVRPLAPLIPVMVQMGSRYCMYRCNKQVRLLLCTPICSVWP